MHQVAEEALDAAVRRGASYADVRGHWQPGPKFRAHRRDES
jgi:hypothetical protein